MSVDEAFEARCFCIDSASVSLRRSRSIWCRNGIWLNERYKSPNSGNRAPSSDGWCGNGDSSGRDLGSWKKCLRSSNVDSGSNVLLVDVCDSIWSIRQHREIKSYSVSSTQHIYSHTHSPNHPFTLFCRSYGPNLYTGSQLGKCQAPQLQQTQIHITHSQTHHTVPHGQFDRQTHTFLSICRAYRFPASHLSLLPTVRTHAEK